MNRTPFSSLFALPILLTAMALPVMAQAADKSAPNIVVIMGDDIGWSNIGVYNQGMMAGRTPNLDQLALRPDRPQRRPVQVQRQRLGL